MKNILKIIRISSKKWFKLLKQKSPYYCEALNNDIYITNILLKHISWYQKSRNIEEIIIRLWMINLIDDIISSWKIINTRENVYFEWKLFKKTFKISYKVKEVYFILLVWEKNNSEFIALSCFIKFIQ